MFPWRVSRWRPLSLHCSCREPSLREGRRAAVAAGRRVPRCRLCLRRVAMVGSRWCLFSLSGRVNVCRGGPAGITRMLSVLVSGESPLFTKMPWGEVFWVPREMSLVLTFPAFPKKWRAQFHPGEQEATRRRQNQRRDTHAQPARTLHQRRDGLRARFLGGRQGGPRLAAEDLHHGRSVNHGYVF